MPKIRLIHPTGIAGEHHPVGAKVDVTPQDARYLVGIGKAELVADEPEAGEIRTQPLAIENGDPKPKARR